MPTRHLAMLSRAAGLAAGWKRLGADAQAAETFPIARSDAERRRRLTLRQHDVPRRNGAERCGSPFGHMVDDGPGATGLRRRINGAAMVFKPATA